MAGKSDAFENDLLKFIFNAVPIANLGDNAATSPLTQLWVALHTADPGEGGSQSTSEVNYTSYARVGVARTTAGWTVTANVVNPAAIIGFPAGTGGSGSAAYWSVGVAQTGAGKVLYSGPINPAIATGNGVTPQLSTATNITED